MLYQRFVQPSFSIAPTYQNRPTNASLEQWATEVGDASYNFDNLLPYFKRDIQYFGPKAGIFNNNTVLEDPTASLANNINGALKVSYNNYKEVFTSWIQPALEEVGMLAIDDFNSGNWIGSAYATFTITPVQAHRSSLKSAFLQRAIRNTTLQVYKQSLAQKLIFQNNTTKGVLVTTGRVDYVLEARRDHCICWRFSVPADTYGIWT